MIWLLLLFVYAALFAFALAMDPHHRVMFGVVPPPKRRRKARLAGAALLSAAIWTATAGLGVAHGLTAFVISLGVSGFAVSLTFAIGSSRGAPICQSPAPRKTAQTFRKDG